jgi:hypothetical protein
VRIQRAPIIARSAPVTRGPAADPPRASSADGPGVQGTRRADARRRAKGRDERRAQIAMTMVGVSVFNSFAPLWGPALAARARR